MTRQKPDFNSPKHVYRSNIHPEIYSHSKWYFVVSTETCIIFNSFRLLYKFQHYIPWINKFFTSIANILSKKIISFYSFAKSKVISENLNYFLLSCIVHITSILNIPWIFTRHEIIEKCWGNRRTSGNFVVKRFLGILLFS